VPPSGTSVPGNQGMGVAGDPVAGELLAALAAGDEAAFARVVHLHYDLVYRIAWRMLGGPGEAEDVAQEVFLRLWRGAERLRETRSLRAWLARVAANLAIDRMRRRRPDSSVELSDLADPAAGPERLAERQAASKIVDAAIAALPERQRVAIVLTYYEELANADVADALGVSIEAVESLLARARRKLKDMLASSRQDIVASME
jgi:RNA polymerase sigma-70 factor (ECF subfamily)